MTEQGTDSQRRVRKAIIPAAGFGTRLFPATKAVKKELFPIIDRQGQAKPIILAIVEEALSAGIESVGIVVQPQDRQLFEDFFQALPEAAYSKKLAGQQADLQHLQEIGTRVRVLTQDAPEGFGHAVFCARDWVQDQPFLVLLGDHVYTSSLETSCAGQLVEVYQQYGKSVVGIETTPATEIDHRGCVTGVWSADGILTVTQLAEKPEVEYARQHLHVEGMAANELLAIFGLYVLSPKIFDYLEQEIRQNLRDRGEFQLTSGLDQLQREAGMIGCRVKGRSFDTGRPEAYRQTLIDFPTA